MGEVKQMKNIRWARRLLYGGGTISILYFAALWAYLGAVYTFQWFWMALGLFLIAAGIFLPRWHRLPKWFRVVWKVGLILALLLFFAVEGLMLFAMEARPEPGADFVIVLGAKVNGTTPSLSLRYRIEAAFEYLSNNPETRVIASGGQGPNEGIPEAKAIADSLERMGIDRERILEEDQSSSTNENLIFSKACIESTGAEPEEVTVVLVSSDFHIFRAKAIARNYGYRNVEGKGSRSVPLLQPNYCVREFFAILKDAVKGNL